MGAEYKPLSPGHSSASEPGRRYGAATAAVTTALWIAFWIVCSVSIIIVNKHVISFSGFKFPISLALWHMFLGTITSRTAVHVLGIPDTIKEHASPALYWQVGMIGVLFGGTLVTGNAALQWLTVPTVQMLKASGPATIYFVGIMMGNEKLGCLQFLKVAVVCTGVGIASYGDLTLSAVGFVLQVVSILMDATRCCTLQKVLHANHIEVGPLVTLSHVAPFAMAALSLPAVVLEGPRLLNDYSKWSGAIPMVLLSGLLASVLNFVVFKIIGLTSALTTSLSGVLKEWACILVAMYVYGTKVTRLQWLGYSIAIAGLMWYQSGRFRVLQSKAAASPLTTPGSRSKEESCTDEEQGRVVTVTAVCRSALLDGSRPSSWGGDSNVGTSAASRSSHSGHGLRVQV